MCNLYTVTRSIEDIAAHFGADVPKPIDMKPDTAKGGKGVVVRAVKSRRVVQEANWGFPRTVDGQICYTGPVSHL